MGIDISSITNASLKSLADTIDKDNNSNGKLDGKEISIFEKKSKNLIKADVATKQEVQELLSQSSNDTTTNPINNSSDETYHELSEKEKKIYQEAVEDKVKELTKSGLNPKEIMQALQKKFTKLNYRLALKEVETVLNMVMSTNYNSKEDVEKIHDNVKKQLKDADKWDGFHKEILHNFEDAAKSDQIKKESDILINKYKEIKATKEKAEDFNEKGHNFSEYVATIKEELQAKDSNGQKEWKKSYTKEAFEILEAYARSDAQSVAESRMYDSESHTKKGIRKEVLKEIEETSNDEYQKDAVKQSKTDRKILARRNRVEDKAADLTHMTKDDIATEIGKRSNQYNFMKKMFSAHKIGDRIFEKLNRSYLDKIKNEDGTYDLSKLKDELLSRIGADYKLNQPKGDKMDELTNIQNHLNDITDADFTDNEIKVLVNMFDFKRGHKDRTPDIVDATVAGLSSAGAGLKASKQINMHQLLEYKFKFTENIGSVLDQLKAQGADVTQISKTEVLIKMEQGIVNDSVINDLVNGLGIGVLSSALFDIVVGKTKDEKSCMSISDYSIRAERYTNAEKYKEYVAKVYKNSPEKVKALHILVDAYKQKYGEKWHGEFQEKLRKVAGFGSKLNSEECRMLKYQEVEAKPKQQETQPATEPQVTVTPIPDPTVTEPCNLVYRNDINLENSNKYYWDEIINMYYSNCLQNHSMKVIRYQLRKVNNIPNNYASVPANLLLPQDLFGDGSCERLDTPNQFKPSPLRKQRAQRVKVKTRRTPDGGYYVGTQCRNRDGSYDTKWHEQKYNSREAAEQAGQELLK